MSFLSSLLKQNDLHEKTQKQKALIEKQAKEKKEAEAKLALHTALTKQYNDLQYRSLFPQQLTGQSRSEHKQKESSSLKNGQQTNSLESSNGNGHDQDRKIIKDRSSDKALSWKQLMSIGNKLDPQELSLKISKIPESINNSLETAKKPKIINDNHDSKSPKVIPKNQSSRKQQQQQQKLDSRSNTPSLASGRSRSNSPGGGEKFIKLNVKKRDLRTLNDIQKELRDKGKLSNTNKQREEAERIMKYREELQNRKNAKIRDEREQRQQQLQQNQRNKSRQHENADDGFNSESSGDMETSAMDIMREENRR